MNDKSFSKSEKKFFNFFEKKIFQKKIFFSEKMKKFGLKMSV